MCGRRLCARVRRAQIHRAHAGRQPPLRVRVVGVSFGLNHARAIMGATDQDKGHVMRFHRRQFLASRGRGRRPPGRLAIARAGLSVAAGAAHHRLSARRLGRHHRAADRRNGCRRGSASRSSSKTVPAPAPTSRPKRSCARRPTATRCCSSRPANAINATLYEKLNYNFLRDIVPVAGLIRVPNVDGGEPVGSGQDRSRVHRLRQGQSRQAQHGVVRQRLDHPHVAASCSR